MADTIFALATPPGRSGVAIIRISGERARQGAEALGAGSVPERTAVLRRLCDPRDGQNLDDALVLRFVAPRSYTGEDVVELHLHGGPAVCRSVSSALGSVLGLRAAEAGEFTRRALLNGKLDLAQVEGLADLLAAETAAQTRQALALMRGALSTSAGSWRDGLLRALAFTEAAIEFPEEDLPTAALDEARGLVSDVQRRLAAEMAGSAAAERLRAGFEVALVGAPNVGKSTLLNALAGREAALTSEIAGTTRDVIEVRMDVQGLPVTFIDMAGLRETSDPLEGMGVARAKRRAEHADLRVFLLEDDDGAALGLAVQPGDLVALAKADIRGPSSRPAVSGLTGQGIPELLQHVAAELANRASMAGLLNRERHLEAIGRALDSVRDAAAGLAKDAPQLELIANDLRSALRSLDVLVGRVDVEAVLDTVFSSFCIGK